MYESFEGEGGEIGVLCEFGNREDTGVKISLYFNQGLAKFPYISIRLADLSQSFDKFTQTAELSFMPTPWRTAFKQVLVCGICNSLYQKV